MLYSVYLLLHNNNMTLLFNMAVLWHREHKSATLKAKCQIKEKCTLTNSIDDNVTFMWLNL